MDFIGHLNENLTGEAMRNILAFLGEKKLPTRRVERAQWLNRIWLQEPRRLLEALSEPERMMLAETVHGDGLQVDVERVNAKHGYSYQMPVSCGYGDHFVILCFVCRDRYEDGLEVVDGMAERLRELLPPPPPLKVRSLKTCPKEGEWKFSVWGGDRYFQKRVLEVYLSERVAPMEVRRMLQLTAAGKLGVSEATGMPSEAARKTVEGVLGAPELDLVLPKTEQETYLNAPHDPGPVRSVAWPVLMQQCGWAKVQGGKLALTAKGKELLGGFTFGRYAEGVRRFFSDTDFDELRRVTVIKGQGGKHAARRRIPLPARRAAILEGLRELPRNRWVELEEAHRVLLAVGGKGRRLVEGAGLYICDPQYGDLSGAGSKLGRVYYRQLIGESLATLGLVDLAYAYPHFLNPELRGNWGMDDECFTTRFDGVKYVRVTALGRYFLGLDKTYEAPVQEQRVSFKVLPNFDIVVTDAAAFSPADAALIERFAERQSDAVWKMNARTVLKALEAGDGAADVLGALENGSGGAVPGTVRRLVEETAARAGAAKSREDAVIVTFRDKETAALVAHDGGASKVVAGWEGETVVVRAKNLKAFQTALRKLGILLP